MALVHHVEAHRLYAAPQPPRNGHAGLRTYVTPRPLSTIPPFCFSFSFLFSFLQMGRQLRLSRLARSLNTVQCFKCANYTLAYESISIARVFTWSRNGRGISRTINIFKLLRAWYTYVVCINFIKIKLGRMTLLQITQNYGSQKYSQW